jgi:hypothetical protein
MAVKYGRILTEELELEVFVNKVFIGEISGSHGGE